MDLQSAQHMLQYPKVGRIAGYILAQYLKRESIGSIEAPVISGCLAFVLVLPEFCTMRSILNPGNFFQAFLERGRKGPIKGSVKLRWAYSGLGCNPRFPLTAPKMGPYLLYRDLHNGPLL